IVTGTTALVSGTTYYATQSVEGCESPTRTAVTATISIVEPPAGEASQTFSLEEGQEISIADIVITAEGSVTWFASEEDAINNTGAIDVNTFTIAIGETVTLYVVQTIGECVSEPFAITVSAVMGLDGFAAGALKVYPNPVKDVLTLSYTSEITSVTVYNLLGQQVLNKNVNQDETQIDLSGLSSGAYMVRVVADDKAAAIKIIKQ
ncbi:MAG: T9SS type A sorting domain-containing protein, partial [Sphingobacteriales bacterium]